MPLSLARYVIGGDNSAVDVAAHPPPLRLPLHTLLASRGQLTHGSVALVTTPSHDGGAAAASLARVELAPAAAVSAALAAALGLQRRGGDALPPIVVDTTDPLSVRFATEVAASLETGAGAACSGAILQLDDVLRVRDAALLADAGYAAQPGDAERLLALSANTGGPLSPDAAAASLATRQPALEALLDGTLLHAAPGGQLLRVPLFGAHPGGAVTLRLTAQPAAAVDGSPALLRVARGLTRVTVVGDDATHHTRASDLRQVTVDTRAWLAGAAARAPGQDAALRRLIAQAASAWGLAATPTSMPAPRVPHAALLVGSPGAGKTAVAEAVAQTCGRPAYRLTALQLYRGGVGDSEAALLSLVGHAAAHGPATIIIEDTETLLPVTPRSPLAARLAALLLRCIRDGGVPDSSDDAGDPNGTSRPPSTGGRLFWIACATSLPAVDRRLLGPGACDGAVVELPLPGPVGRAAMLAALLSRQQQAGGDDAIASTAALAAALAARTHGYSPADLEEAVRAAALAAMTAVDGSDGTSPPQPLSLSHYTPALAAVRPSLMLQAIGGAPRTVPLSALVGFDTTVATAVDAVLTPLRHGAAYASLGMPPPRGLLITGPGGTGKTTLAHALAHAATSTGLANALVVSGPDIVSALVGSSEAALSALFARARQLAPCVMVLDAFETLAPVRQYGGERDGNTGSGRQAVAAAKAPKLQRKTPRGAAASPDAKPAKAPVAAAAAGPVNSRAGDRLLSVLLTEMDGVDGGGSSGGIGVASGGDVAAGLCADGDGACNGSTGTSPLRLLSALPSFLQLPLSAPSALPAAGGGGGAVVIVAVASHPSQLDPAVLRPGRLDTHVSTALPDARARGALLAHFFGRSPVALAGAPREAPFTAVDVGAPFDWHTALTTLVASTAGWCHADVEALWREAAMGALRRALTAGGAPAADTSTAAGDGGGAAITWVDITAALHSVGAVRRGLRVAPPS
jgi:SpoVK/Ycf46/Vps4 family AAA+-type ATPase